MTLNSEFTFMWKPERKRYLDLTIYCSFNSILECCRTKKILSQGEYFLLSSILVYSKHDLICCSVVHFLWKKELTIKRWHITKLNGIWVNKMCIIFLKHQMLDVSWPEWIMIGRCHQNQNWWFLTFLAKQVFILVY